MFRYILILSIAVLSSSPRNPKSTEFLTGDLKEYIVKTIYLEKLWKDFYYIHILLRDGLIRNQIMVER